MKQEQKPLWRRAISWILVFAALAVVDILIVVTLRVNGMGVNQITLWDWVGVLIIPVALLAAGLWLNSAQAQREKTAAEQREQDEALQRYLDQMSHLLINRRLHRQPAGNAEHLVAQARTTTVLLMLDRNRKRRPLKLVYELGLINRNEPKITLKNAGLNGADLGELALPDACLSHVDLRASNLSGSNLSGSDFRKADLRGAGLANVDLSDADLTDANLLPYDERQPAKMSIHNLKDWDVDSSEADIRFTAIRPNLTPTNLSSTNLEGADLRGAILANTDLRNTRGLTEEQLEQAIGNQRTLLPSGLGWPEAWSKSIEEQIEMRDKRNEEGLSAA